MADGNLRERWARLYDEAGTEQRVRSGSVASPLAGANNHVTVDSSSQPDEESNHEHW